MLGRIVVKIWGVKVSEGVKGCVVGEEYGVCAGGIGGEAEIFKETAVEEGLEVVGIGAVPGNGTVVGAGAETVVGEEGTEIVGEYRE